MAIPGLFGASNVQFILLQRLDPAISPRPLSPLLPSLRIWAFAGPEEEISMERTLVLLKPDCVERRLVGRILSRFEEKGFNIIAMKLMQVTPELARRHYAEHVEKSWYPGLEAFITASPLVAAIVEGPEVIRVVRELVGATNGLKAAPGHHPRRFQLQPADEPRPCLRRTGIGPARNRHLLRTPGNPRLPAGVAALAPSPG